MKAVGDKFIVLPEEKPKKAGSIELPPSKNHRHLTGKVVSVDPKFDTSVKEGDRLIFRPTEQLEHNGTTYEIVTERDIIAIINDTE